MSLTRPPGTPPARVLAAAWLCLYSLTGFAGWLAWRRATTARPLRLWGWQLAASACLAPAFFALHNPMFALAADTVLLALIVLTILAFAALRPLAAWLMAPHLAGTAFLAYLLAGFWWLNPS